MNGSAGDTSLCPDAIARAYAGTRCVLNEDAAQIVAVTRARLAPCDHTERSTRRRAVQTTSRRQVID
jgi:hypothetical protein